MGLTASARAEIVPEPQEVPLFGFTWSLSTGAGGYGASASGSDPWGIVPVPLSSTGDLGATAAIDTLSQVLRGCVTPGASTASVVFNMSLELQARAQCAALRDNAGNVLAWEPATFTVSVNMGTLPDHPMDWPAYQASSGLSADGARVRFLATGTDVVPGQPIVVRPYASTLSQQGESHVIWGGSVTGQAAYGTMLDLRPGLRDISADYGGLNGYWGAPGCASGTFFGPRDPFPDHGVSLLQLGLPGDKDRYRDSAGLGGWMRANFTGSADQEFPVSLNLRCDIAVGAAAEAARPTKFSAFGYDETGAPLPAAPKVQPFVQGSPLGFHDGCAETAAAMIVDYWQQRQSGKALDPNDAEAIGNLRHEIEACLPPLHPARLMSGVDRVETVRDMLNGYFVEKGMKLLARLDGYDHPATLESLLGKQGPAILAMERQATNPETGAPMAIGHTVVVDGQSMYMADPLDPGRGAARFISVKDTWTAGTHDMRSPDVWYGAWTDPQGLEWWPLLNPGEAYWGYKDYRYTGVINVLDINAAPVLRRETFDRRHDGEKDDCRPDPTQLFSAAGAVTMGFKPWPFAPLSPGPLMEAAAADEGEEDMALQVVSADGTGSVTLWSPLTDVVRIRFDYALLGDANVALLLNDVPLAVLDATAEAATFDETFDLVALGVSRDSLGALSFQFKAAGDPELWLNDLVMANPDAVPEPSTVLLLTAGLGAVAGRHRRKLFLTA